MEHNKVFEVFFVWLLSIIIWFLYRYFFRTTPQLIEEILLKPLVFVGLTIWFSAKKGKITPQTLGFRGENKKQILLWGGGFGAFLVFESIIVELLIKHKSFVFPENFLSSLIMLSIPIATAFSEEILYRGFIMEYFWKHFDNEWIANIISTLLFVVAHIAQGIFMLQHTNAELAKYLWLIGVLGFASGFIYQRTRSIYSSMIFHALWNLSNVLIK